LEDQYKLAEFAANIVSAYVGNNNVKAADVPSLIVNVHAALTRAGGAVEPAPVEKPKPAVNPRRSVFPDFIICLEDGKRFKSLKRHIDVHYGLTPEEYRRKWSLPADYPMVAPNYAAERSQIAKKMSLGRNLRAKRK